MEKWVVVYVECMRLKRIDGDRIADEYEHV